MQNHLRISNDEKQMDLIKLLNEVFKGRAISPQDSISTTSDDDFFVEDNTSLGYCIFIEKGEGNIQTMMHIINLSNKVIGLWAIDGFFYPKGKGSSKCDAALFDDSAFCLIEFKLNATSRSPLQILQNQKKAISQLEETTKLINQAFKDSGKIFPDYVREAYICVPSFYPRQSTTIVSEQVRFLEKYGVSLFETNQKAF